MRTIIQHDPFAENQRPFWGRGYWDAKWVGHPDVKGTHSSVTAYKKSFHIDSDSQVRIHVTADERYELYLDGERIGRGSERGDRENWFFETYDLSLKAGEHTIVARTWWLGSDAPSPYAQISVRPGFLLAAEGDFESILSTGIADWEAKIIPGYSCLPCGMAFGTGAKVKISGNEYPWGFEYGMGDAWVIAQAIGETGDALRVNEVQPVWMLKPATLPPMLEISRNIGVARHVQSVESEDTAQLQVNASDHLEDESGSWNSMLLGEKSISIPANTIRRVIIDLEDYYCAYPEIVVSGGAGSTVRMLWSESLYMQTRRGPKGNRDEIDGKYFLGIGDIFEPDGGENRKFETLWWEAGRYIEVFVSTADSALTVESLKFRETHYPYEFEGRFESSDTRLDEVSSIAIRTLEMCSHETYMDCPFWEQLQYIGDTRLQVLVTYALTGDGRLPQKALTMFDKSRKNSGITQSRYPCRVMQIIPPFSLWWVAMVHDYALWRGDREFVADLMPGVRSVLDAFRRWINADGLLDGIERWNFMDWVNGWGTGIPPGGDDGVSGLINWQYVWVLKQAAELEDWLGEHELAARNRRYADSVAKVANEAFWHDGRGLFADDLAKEHFSEHSQCLALLGGSVDDSKRARIIDGLLTQADLSRATIYFSHYLFETYRSIGQIDKLFEGMDLWFGLKDMGFKTTPEAPEPSRSDCHAWGAHPVFHYYASVLGIRPMDFGFGKVLIEPQLGDLQWVKGCMPHPNGYIQVEVRKNEGQMQVDISLPEDTFGELRFNGSSIELKPGQNHLE